MDNRENFIELVKKIIVGPFPLDSFKQENGEEILFKDSPLRTYISGVLFPKSIYREESLYEGVELKEEGSIDIINVPDDSIGVESSLGTSANSVLDDEENASDSEVSNINNYRQSALGFTAKLCDINCPVNVSFSGGRYAAKNECYPIEYKDSDGNWGIKKSEKPGTCYYRKSFKGHVNITDLPNISNRHKKFSFFDENNTEIAEIGLLVTYRMDNVFTFTIMNTNEVVISGKDSSSKKMLVDDEKCWFQVSFSVQVNDSKFDYLPDNYFESSTDDDYQLNSLLYKDVKSYAIGHGCAAAWNESKDTITAECIPEYDVKPIVPTTSSAELDMFKYMNSIDFVITDLSAMCNEYESWIERIEHKASNLEGSLAATAKKQIILCNQCLERMRKGITLLSSDTTIQNAFQLMNRAMLMQQLHYRMPLVEYKDEFDRNGDLVLKKNTEIPSVDKPETWHKDGFTYGKWRPFQIAFILMNIDSMVDDNSPERKMVDLIWFPTGGGKTEAYLGLTAFTILYRRMTNKDDAGTAVIMRYTLRLLTSQQFARAASLICSLEYIRSKKKNLLGNSRISIGLWVGHEEGSGKISDIKKKIKDISLGASSENVGVVLKCPWCGASMKTFKIKKDSYASPGYELSDDKKKILYRCGNYDCDFSDEKFSLPLKLLDEEIYEEPPTLIFGTVDKFATIPFKMESKIIFGGNNQYKAPDLIIQDELHLITGPLGSTVGLYETLIHQLCVNNGGKPKIVASTATISHAKEQCNALYACGEDNVFQFPVQGIDYRDCFFAREKTDAIGRKYVGLFGNASSSSANASIYIFAALLYAANEMQVENPNDRDPYYTNLAYFNSIKELGRTSTWFIADIKEHLEVIYASRLETRKEGRRYLYDSHLQELTSRMSSDEIPDILQQLENKLGSEKAPLDVCLATNMVSVGVDVSRLGLMTVTGQPKSMSEYIQASSRVGRSSSAPGVVFMLYNISKSRDRSHYEKFYSDHTKLYFSVEPTSVTPFSRPLRERALAAIFVGLYRMMYGANNVCSIPNNNEYSTIKNIILDRVRLIDLDEIEDTENQLDDLYDEWKAWNPQKYTTPYLNPDPEAPLIYALGTIKHPNWQSRGWGIPNSMRSVDRECRLDCSKRLLSDGEDA